MDFFDQYKHPNWQKKRLEVLEDAEFTCERCFDAESQLHVHHKRYIKGRKIWEYETSELEALCSACHKQAHNDVEVLQSIIAKVPSDCLPELCGVVLGYLSNVQGRSGVGFGSTQEFPEDIYYESLVGKLAAVSSDKLSIQMLEGLISAIEALQPGEKKEVLVCGRQGFSYEGPY